MLAPQRPDRPVLTLPGRPATPLIGVVNRQMNGMHCVNDAAPAALAVPSGHGTHVDESAAEYVLTPHCRHADGVNVPGLTVPLHVAAAENPPVASSSDEPPAHAWVHVAPYASDDEHGRAPPLRRPPTNGGDVAQTIGTHV